jgi:DNA-binding NarL/FixJ family response regulator
VIRPRVLLADDHAPLLEAYQRFLVEECDVVGVVTEGRDVVSVARALRPDVIVMDVMMRHCNGLEAAQQLRQEQPEMRIVFLTTNDDTDLAAAAFRAGGSGYLLKWSARSELPVAIREVLDGRFYVTPRVTEGLSSSVGRRAAAHDPVLTPRQQEIVRLVAAGRSAKEVAALLDISPRTVAFHKARIMRQLNVKTSAALIHYALAHHLVQE